MKSITKLLKRMEKSSLYDYEPPYSIEIFADGSGSIKDNNDTEICDFENNHHMNIALDYIEDELRKENKVETDKWGI